MSNRVSLDCSCCGLGVGLAIQSPEHDEGYGTCYNCITEQLNWHDNEHERDRLRKLIYAQWPDQGEKI